MIDIRIEDNILIATINNPPTNALTLEGFNKIKEIMDFVEFEQPSIKGIILTNEGNKFFCSGYDLNIFMNCKTGNDVENFFVFEEPILARLFSFPKPIIAVIDGNCTAGGFIYAMACDYRFATTNDRVRFGMTEMNLGIGITRANMELVRYTIMNDKFLQEILYDGQLYDVLQMTSKEIINQLVTEKNEGIQIAKEKINKWMEFPYTFKTVKYNLKRNAINTIQSYIESKGYIHEVIEYILNPAAQEKFKKIYDILNKVK